MQKKYYAVKTGTVPGIYESWDECRRFVDGFPGAQYKSFKTKKEALAYINGDSAVESDIPVCPPKTAIAFVDGSYDAEQKRYAYGCILLYPDGTQTELSGNGDNPNAVPSRNVAGELTGAMTAVKTAYAAGFRKIVIYHDYEGIAKWYEQKWKAESFVAKAYLVFMKPYMAKMDISFVKVDAHTGVTLNERADELAKGALKK